MPHKITIKSASSHQEQTAGNAVNRCRTATWQFKLHTAAETCALINSSAWEEFDDPP